jgi:hypothetical protein
MGGLAPRRPPQSPIRAAIGAGAAGRSVVRPRFRPRWLGCPCWVRRWRFWGRGEGILVDTGLRKPIGYVLATVAGTVTDQTWLPNRRPLPMTHPGTGFMSRPSRTRRAHFDAVTTVRCDHDNLGKGHRVFRSMAGDGREDRRSRRCDCRPSGYSTSAWRRGPTRGTFEAGNAPGRECGGTERGVESLPGPVRFPGGDFVS